MLMWLPVCVWLEAAHPTLPPTGDVGGATLSDAFTLLVRVANRSKVTVALDGRMPCVGIPFVIIVFSAASSCSAAFTIASLSVIGVRGGAVVEHEPKNKHKGESNKNRFMLPLFQSQKRVSSKTDCYDLCNDKPISHRQLCLALDSPFV